MPHLRKVIVAIDSFKGSISSEEAGKCVADSIREINPSCHIEVIAIGDGGEGSGRIITKAHNGTLITTRAHDALMRPCSAFYGQLADARAVVELADTCGLALLNLDERNPRTTSSFGCGEVIREAIKCGNKEILLCLGGSATNDGGMGVLHALGYRFLDHKGDELPPCGDSLILVRDIKDDHVIPSLREVRFLLLNDVVNCFYGKKGAAYVYAPQKGATMQEVVLLDEGLQNYARVLMSHSGVDVQRISGSGAAGGVAGGCISLLRADVVSGIEYVLDACGFDAHLQGCDLVITGEGRIDQQSFMGKVLQHIVHHSHTHDVPVLAFAGQVADDFHAQDYGLLGAYGIHPPDFPLSLAMQKEHTMTHLSQCVVHVLADLGFC